MIGYATEFVLARHPGLFRLYRSDMSWQTARGEGRGLGLGGLQCYAEMMVVTRNRMKKKKEKRNQKQNKRSMGHLRTRIACPPSPRDISDPEIEDIAGCQWLKDGLWPLS